MLGALLCQQCYQNITKHDPGTSLQPNTFRMPNGIELPSASPKTKRGGNALPLDTTSNHCLGCLSVCRPSFSVGSCNARLARHRQLQRGVTPCYSCVWPVQRAGRLKDKSLILAWYSPRRWDEFSWCCSYITFHFPLLILVCNKGQWALNGI